MCETCSDTAQKVLSDTLFDEMIRAKDELLDSDEVRRYFEPMYLKLRQEHSQLRQRVFHNQLSDKQIEHFMEAHRARWDDLHAKVRGYKEHGALPEPEEGGEQASIRRRTAAFDQLEPIKLKSPEDEELKYYIEAKSPDEVPVEYPQEDIEGEAPQFYMKGNIVAHWDAETKFTLKPPAPDEGWTEPVPGDNPPDYNVSDGFVQHDSPNEGEEAQPEEDDEEEDGENMPF